ncbi:hypothetical protein Halru_0982 [Halovivax ruber XH-70]|uniref:Uncharacterized protein n=1 Tax=Halovivax ruber (strain DSM 18193 / JCM 13892 / XH-70) TaxID=797302 RepID=L0IBH7_HALRX|nr:hypothetical protein [Halovivax ruber]AGB15601.1 hypothetical protein Halru_0982 [Halovivax ruber XH-70]
MHHIITHGDVASATGSVTDEDGTEHSICDVFSFDGYSGDDPIASIESSVIATD